MNILLKTLSKNEYFNKNNFFLKKNYKKYTDIIINFSHNFNFLQQNKRLFFLNTFLFIKKSKYNSKILTSINNYILKKIIKKKNKYNFKKKINKTNNFYIKLKPYINFYSLFFLNKKIKIKLSRRIIVSYLNK